MTENRKNYLDNISKEERTIRRVIGEYKIRMCDSKEYITRFNNKPKSFDVALVYEEAKKDVRFYNSAIKSLKKLLPAPIRFVRDGIWYYNSCSVCKGAINEDELYCHTCGQKMR